MCLDPKMMEGMIEGGILVAPKKARFLKVSRFAPQSIPQRAVWSSAVRNV